MKADELWQKWFDGEAYGEPVMSHAGFLAALAEYGEHVKAEAVKVCQSKGHYLAAGLVEKMPLP